MKIICGTDFSIHARNAADVAAALACRSKTTLRLMHGVEPAAVEFLPKNTVDNLRERLQRRIVAEGNRLRLAGVEMMESVALGRPHEVLANTAKSTKTWWSFPPSDQCHPADGWSAASQKRPPNSRKVPTLVVRDHESLLSWAEGKRTLTVFVGYDFSSSSETALRWVASLTQIGACRVTVAYVSWPPKEAWRFGAGGHSSLTENNLVVRTLLERDLKERCARAFGKGRPRGSPLLSDECGVHPRCG